MHYPLKNIQLGRHQVGAGLKPLFLPDIGTFFNQDIEKAEQMIRGLHLAGVNVVKGEILNNAEVALDIDYDESYLSHENSVIKENYRKLIERKVVSLEDYARIFELCASLDMDVVVSVYDEEGVDFAVGQGVIALKIASSNITHRPLIEYVCSTSLPIIIDTGKAGFSEIAQAIEWLELFGKQDYILQHSPKAPPEPVELHNMRFLTTLQDAFKCQVGLSDHHDGNEMLSVATVMGVAILEKGLYLDGDSSDQGVKHAMTLSEVSDVLKTIDTVFSSLGSGKVPMNVTSHPARMGIVAAKDIQPGEFVSRQNVRFAFPKIGLGPEAWWQIEGKAALKLIKANQPITFHDIVHSP